MATEAQKVTRDATQVAYLKALIGAMKRTAHDASARQRSAQKGRGTRNPTRFELCVIGIQNELNFGTKPPSDIRDLEAIFSRMCEEIERTIGDMKANRKVTA